MSFPYLCSILLLFFSFFIPPSTRAAATPQDGGGRDEGKDGDGVADGRSVRRSGEGEGAFLKSDIANYPRNTVKGP